MFELSEVMRQRDDKDFAEILNRIRERIRKHTQGRIQTGLTGLYKPVRFSKERKSITLYN